MSNEKPEALELADLFENWATTFGEHQSGSRSRVAVELRRLHARVQELERELESIGAGGVSAQRITQQSPKDHIAQDRKMVAAQEPFGYFKAEPFGWRDCAETDEGAVALYEAPQPQADALDAARYRWLIDYLISDRVDLDDAIGAARTAEDITKVIDAAIAAQEGGAV